MSRHISNQRRLPNKPKPSSDYDAPLCGDCGAAMSLQIGHPVSPDEPVKYWRCAAYPRCRGTHSAHQKTGAPLGIPADAATRQARAELHRHLDAMWRGGEMSRHAAYGWLRTVLFLSRDDAHVSRLTAEQCARAVAAAKARR